MDHSQYTTRLFDVISPERFEFILEQLAQQAEAGSLPAIRMVLSLYHRPKATPPGQLRFEVTNYE